MLGACPNPVLVVASTCSTLLHPRHSQNAHARVHDPHQGNELVAERQMSFENAQTTTATTTTKQCTARTTRCELALKLLQA
jgi:hypothetical protein